jgi:hypothetical protein
VKSVLKPEKAETIIATAGKTHIEKYNKDKLEEQKKKEEKAKKDAEKKKTEDSDQSKKAAAEEKKKAELLEKIKKQEQEKAAKEAVPKEAQAGDKKEEKEETKAPPGNGGITDKYIWTQTLTEVHVTIPIDETVTKKELTVQIQEDRLLVAVKGLPAPILDGAWPEKIDVPHRSPRSTTACGPSSETKAGKL